MSTGIFLPRLETWYHTYDRELQAIYLVIKCFRHFLKGRDFLVLTDYKPLIYALSSRLDRHFPRQIQHLDFSTQFTTDLRHVLGSADAAADALSRVSTNSLRTDNSSPVIDFWELALAQTCDPELAKLRANHSAAIRPQEFSSNNFQLSPLHVTPRNTYNTMSCDQSFCVAKCQHWCSLFLYPMSTCKISLSYCCPPGYLRPYFDHVHIDLVGPLWDIFTFLYV